MSKKTFLTGVLVLGCVAGPAPDLWSCHTSDPQQGQGGIQASQHASAPVQQPPVIAGCGVQFCGPSPEPVACMWNPPLYWCPTHEELPSCECIAMRCHGESCIIGGDTLFYTLALFDKRPEGPCFEIPCGECFEWYSGLCGDKYACMSSMGGDECGLMLSCSNTFIREEWKTAWWSTGTDCCSDEV